VTMMKKAQELGSADPSTPLADRTRWRVVTAARVFALATAFGLAVTTGSLAILTVPFMGLVLLAAIMSLPVPTPGFRALSPIIEGALASLLLASTGEAATPLLVYLLIPAFVGGVHVGSWGALLAIIAECCTGGVALVAGNQSALLTDTVEASAPWMLVGLGLGLLGAWMRASTDKVLSEQQRYESAHRLLSQLHKVTRELPHGLDAPSLAHHTLSQSIADLDVVRSTLLLRDPSDELVQFAVSGPGRFEEPLELDALVRECWDTRTAQLGAPDLGPEKPLFRAVLPLQMETRMLGVMVVDSDAPLSTRQVRMTQARLDEQSLRLEAGLLFEQVRSMATVEERHRLAREIHDGIAQEIASLGYLVDDLAATTGSAAGNDAARTLRTELSRIVNELRLSIFDLRMEVNHHGGLSQALADYARDVGTRSGMTIHLALAEGARLPIDVQTELLRIAQEAITNARKHAHAHNIWVTLNTNGTVTLLRVEDDGVGNVHPKDDRFGLRMMRERADRIGAELAVTSRPRGGTSVVVALQPSNHNPGGHRGDLSIAR
jgi:signal transduction histidine kinase